MQQKQGKKMSRETINTRTMGCDVDIVVYGGRMNTINHQLTASQPPHRSVGGGAICLFMYFYFELIYIVFSVIR